MRKIFGLFCRVLWIQSIDWACVINMTMCKTWKQALEMNIKRRQTSSTIRHYQIEYRSSLTDIGAARRIFFVDVRMEIKKTCKHWMLCYQRNHSSCSDVIIFAFPCCILSQNWTHLCCFYVFQENNALLRSRKTSKSIDLSLVRPPAVSSDFK